MVLLVLAGLAVAADVGARAYAQSRVAAELRTELDLPTEPAVRVGGVPFLTQALAGRYTEIEVQADAVPVPGFGEVAVRATLRGLGLPPSALTARTLPPVRAERVDAEVRVGAGALGGFLGVPDLQISAPAEAPGTGVQLTGTLELGPVSAELTVQADVELVDGSVVITARNISAGGPGPDSGSLGEQLLQGALRQLSATIDPAQLPFGLSATGVEVRAGELVLTGTGTDVLVVSGS